MNELKIDYGKPNSKKEVKNAFKFICKQLAIRPSHPRQLDYYIKVYENTPQLLIIAKA
jgi:hypothetical protein